MRYLYKKLNGSDVAVLRDLLKVFVEAFVEQNTYQGAVPRDSYLRDLLEERHFIALGAFFGEVVVGGLVAYELEKLEQERSEIYIYDLAVQESRRRKGLARSLINRLKLIARERSAWVIFVQADQGDTAAITLYESLGKREDVYNFDIPVW